MRLPPGGNAAGPPAPSPGFSRASPAPYPGCLSAGAPPPSPGVASGGPTFSHLNALRAAMRIEAYGLYAQKWAEKPLGRPQTSSFFPVGFYQTLMVLCH